MDQPELDINETKARIVEMLTAAATLFPNSEVGYSNYKAYATMLCDIPLPLLTAAIDQCAAEVKFYPSVAEIREKALALTTRTEISGMEAWAIVIEALQRYGYNRPRPPFEDPLIDQAIKFFGGWLELCNSENVVADRAHFAKIYDQLVQRKIQDARLLPSARLIKQSVQKELTNGSR